MASANQTSDEETGGLDGNRREIPRKACSESWLVNRVHQEPRRVGKGAG